VVLIIKLLVVLIIKRSTFFDHSKVDFKKFSPSSLDDINDLNFASLGKNYKKLKWDEIDYSTIK